MAKADVTIYGAGAFGLASAYVMARRGAKVRVVDPAGVGVGASGGIVGALAPHTPDNWNDKKAFQFRALILARTFWPGIEAVSGLGSGYGRIGRLQAVTDARGLELAQARGRSAESLWCGEAAWRVIDAPSGWAPQSPTGLVIHDTLSARLHPARACAALAAAIRALGGEITADVGAAEGAVLHATGWEGLHALSQAFGREVGGGVKGQAVLFDLARENVPQIQAEGLHIIPHDDGTVAVGSTSERVFDDARGTDAQADALVARARSALPLLEGAREICRWAGVRPRARSRAPMLGAWPGRAGHFIANGGFKIGFGMAPLVAEVMADLILEGQDAIPADFRVEASL